MTRWWDRSLMVTSWALLALGTLVWRQVRTASSFPATETLAAIVIGAVALAITSRWRARSRDIAPLPSAFGLATVAPLAMLPVLVAGVGPPSRFYQDPLDESRDPTALLGLDGTGWNTYALAWLGMILAMVSIAPFCWELTRRMPAGPGRWVVRFGVLACLVGALLMAVLETGFLYWSGSVGTAEYWWLFMTVAVLLASAAAAQGATQSGTMSTAAAITTTLAYMGMGLTVSAANLALARTWWPTLGLPALAVAATTAIIGRVAIRPLEAEADAARRERDMVLSALESERSRLASAIHDGPLADLALLTLQLDAPGDGQRAELVRSIAGELRSLGNELRVPILDDLGAGPAIEWLAGRVSERTQVAIETELAVDEHRPPAPVELAVFRVAQEAILNATKHGRGPVKVRYASDQAATRLVVTDAGPGIAPSAQDVAARSGHLGLTLMARRAEAIGARLEIRSLQDGGTQVDLLWPAT